MTFAIFVDVALYLGNETKLQILWRKLTLLYLEWICVIKTKTGYPILCVKHVLKYWVRRQIAKISPKLSILMV